MRRFFFVAGLFLLGLPLAAQQSFLSCEPAATTLRLLEAVPPVAEASLPYEQRVGALRTLAQTHPGDFFIQRAYQDSFRQHRTLADEFDRALAMYHARPADPLSRYWEARLLRWHEPARARIVLEESLSTHPKFAWPHLDISEFNTLPGQRDEPAFASHLKAFKDACPEAFVIGMVQDPAATRSAIERRNSPLEIRTWPALWKAEEGSGIAAEEHARRVRSDLKRIEAWTFRATPELSFVYREAARILKDPAVLASLRAKVQREAPYSMLALSFVQDDWSQANPPPDRNAPPTAFRERQDKEAQSNRELVRKWPYSPLLTMVVMQMNRDATEGRALSTLAADLAVIDQALRARELSPDANEMWPPIETAIARIYVSSKVRLTSVPDLLGAAMLKIHKQSKYDFSPDLFPADQRSSLSDWPAMTAKQVEEIRADYFLASDRPADARTVIEQALERLNPSVAASGRAAYERSGWLKRLGDVDAREDRVQDALTHYQASMAGMDAKMIATSPIERFASIKRYYLAHGGTDEKWPEWVSAGGKGAKPAGRTPPAFVTALPDFSAKDLAGRTWQLRDLHGKATFVNFWATWCGPCRYEHPGVEELYQRIKDRGDVQVLTISVDETLAPVTVYMKEKGYTFPVIHASQLADKLFPYSGLPTNFLVDAKGVRTGMYGFNPASTGVDRLIEDLTKAAK